MRGAREITPYMFRLLDWWARQGGDPARSFRFLEASTPESRRHIKLFLQLYGHNRLSTTDDRLTLSPGTLGVVLQGDHHEETWLPDEQGLYLQAFIGLFPGRLSINIAGSGGAHQLPRSSRVYAGASLPFTEGVLLDHFLCFAHRRAPPGPHLARTLADLIRSGVRPEGLTAHTRIVRLAVSHILENPCHPDMSVQWLAGKLDCNPDYLSRRFHLETGETLMSYVRELRMEIASDLLLGRRMPVAEVAVLCGYRDHSYFSRLFRTRYGLTPSAYARKRK